MEEKSSVTNLQLRVGWGGGGRGEMAAQRRILPLIILLAAQLATGETS